MKVSVYNQAGIVVGEEELDESVFGVAPNIPLMHQAVMQQQANSRLGNASTKTRAFVVGSVKKMYKQKGTGRARHGSRKVPSWIGGGVAHGPHPRSYEQHMPKKMRRQAIRCALSVKVRDGQIILVDQFTFDRPRTRDMVGVIDKLPVGGKVLLTLATVDMNLVLSARNIPNLHALPANALNTRDLLNHDYIVATVPAIRAVETWLALASSGSSEDAE